MKTLCSDEFCTLVFLSSWQFCHYTLNFTAPTSSNMNPLGSRTSRRARSSVPMKFFVITTSQPPPTTPTDHMANGPSASDKSSNTAKPTSYKTSGPTMTKSTATEILTARKTSEKTSQQRSKTTGDNQDLFQASSSKGQRTDVTL